MPIGNVVITSLGSQVSVALFCNVHQGHAFCYPCFDLGWSLYNQTNFCESLWLLTKSWLESLIKNHASDCMSEVPHRDVGCQCDAGDLVIPENLELHKRLADLQLDHEQLLKTSAELRSQLAVTKKLQQDASAKLRMFRKQHGSNGESFCRCPSEIQNFKKFRKSYA